ncbi:MAG: hypothetical protein AAGA57_12885 [Planctomycetota bacterium]
MADLLPHAARLTGFAGLGLSVALAAGCDDKSTPAGANGPSIAVSAEPTAHPLDAVREAKAFLAPTRNLGKPVRGEVWFSPVAGEDDPALQVLIQLEHLEPESRYALTLHEYGDLSGGELGPPVLLPINDDEDTPVRPPGLLAVVQGGDEIGTIRTVDISGMSVAGQEPPILGRTVSLRKLDEANQPGEPLAIGVIGRVQTLPAPVGDSL